jgi:alkylation response protein AidB-like acyl-CoA dehydrogenase
MGELASATGGFTFTDCEVPVKNMIGREGDGWEVMRRALYWERAGILGSALGLCEDVLLRSIRFAKNRVAFGKAIGEHQVIKHKLADMKTRLEAARHLVYNLSWEKDSGINDMMSMAITKNVVTESLIQNASEAVQIFGGRGYMREYEVERIFRDARLLTIVGGTAEIQWEIIDNRLLRLDLDDIAIETPVKFHQE